VTYRGKPILYVRVSTGGREAARTQERQLRQSMAAAGIPLHEAHAYRDIDTPAHTVGRALGMLLEEASVGRVSVVIVPSLGYLGCNRVLRHALTLLLRGGAYLVAANDIVGDAQIAHEARQKLRTVDPRTALVTPSSNPADDKRCNMFLSGNDGD
jgi:hypothetical protein